jgi:hypothetical protein
MLNLVTAIDNIKINALAIECRGGREVWSKRRRKGSEYLARVANCFFRLAHDPIHVCVGPEEWQRREISCFELLYGRRFQAYVDGSRALCFDQLPGLSLRVPAERGTLSPEMLISAGREFRRAHGLWCEQMHGFWSHGDAQLSNVIYEAADDRSRLIDFEVVHDLSLSADARHAHDLLLFLLDLVGYVDAAKWIPFALSFLEGYGRRRVLDELQGQLFLDRGLPAFWRRLRTGFLSRADFCDRIHALRSALSSVAPLNSDAAEEKDRATLVSGSRA